MSSFNCHCGHTTHDREEAADQSGILLGLSSLRELEGTVAQALVSFLSTPREQQAAWLKARFGPEYPAARISTTDAAQDIITSVVDATKWLRTFRCANCKRLAIEETFDSNEWSFFARLDGHA